ncbi:MAG: hypothetical protein AAGA80_15735 [Cyanobacteria bacterium P01_F01_bin.143]
MSYRFTSSDLRGMHAKGLGIKEICAYSWLINQKAVGKKIIVYREDFRKWLAKTPAGEASISRRHGSRVLHNLGKRGFAEVKSRGYGAFEITLFSLDFVFGRESQDKTDLSSEPKSQDEDPSRGSPNNSLSAKVKQQQLIKIKQLCTQAGIKYRLEKDWWEIVSHGIEKVEATINLMKYRSLTTPITNAPGWFKKALRCNYHLDHNPDSLSVLKTVQQTYEYCLDKFNQWGMFPSRGELELPKKTSVPQRFPNLV